MDIEALRTRREERRRAIRRRRRLAVGLIATAAALVAAIVVVAAGSSNSPPRTGTPVKLARTRTAGARRSARGGRSGTASASTTATGRASASAGPPGTEPVPIPMYHVIAAPPPGAPFPGLYVAPAEFAEQMQALKGAGWHAVTLDQAEAYWRHGVA